MIRTCIQIQIPLNPNGSSMRMEVSVMIQCWQRHLEPGSGSALADIWSIRRYLSSLLVCSRFSISRPMALIKGLMRIHSLVAAYGAFYRVSFVARVKLGVLTADLHFFCLSVPRPFTCSITPRDKRAEELITANPQA